MKRIWNLALGTAVLCTALLCGCALSGTTAPDSAAPTDPLTGQELQYPGERTAAVVIDNAASSTTQWGIGSASVVLEALTESGQPTSLCLAYPSVSAMPTVGPVTLGQDLYWRLLSGQEVLPIQRGAGQFARNYLDYYNLRAVDALEVGRNAFSCPASTVRVWPVSGETGVSPVRRTVPSGTASVCSSTLPPALTSHDPRQSICNSRVLQLNHPRHLRR